MTIKTAERILYQKTPATEIYRTTWTPDFVEFLCDVEGDAITYRIYPDGKIYEK